MSSLSIPSYIEDLLENYNTQRLKFTAHYGLLVTPKIRTKKLVEGGLVSWVFYFGTIFQPQCGDRTQFI